MSNPLYGQMQQQIPQNNIFQRFQQFQRMFNGDARQQVQQLLNSGKVNQNQYNQAIQMANQFMKMMGGK
jgi:vancomycin permeability regulator SanA